MAAPSAAAAPWKMVGMGVGWESDNTSPTVVVATDTGNATSSTSPQLGGDEPGNPDAPVAMARALASMGITEEHRDVG
jgi:hypothetical protein